MSVLLYLFALIPFYLVGCISTGRIIARSKGIALESQGSGNIGATNVARVLGKRSGLMTLLGDIAKGMIGVGIAGMIGNQSFQAATGVAVVAGHCFSIPGKWKGGKGVATALGVFLILAPLPTVISIIIFISVFAAFSLVSLSSLIAAISIPLLMLCYPIVMNHPPVSDALFIASAIISLIVVGRHYQNIQRLIEGREPKFQTAKER